LPYEKIIPQQEKGPPFGGLKSSKLVTKLEQEAESESNCPGFLESDRLSESNIS